MTPVLFPHSFRALSTRGIYGRLVAALSVLLVAGVLRYGAAVAFQIGLVAAIAVFIDRGMSARSRNNNTVLDTLLAVWLLLALLPPGLSWYVPVVGTVSGVLLGKWTFGGVGSYWMHPTLVGYLIIFTSFPTELAGAGTLPFIWPSPRIDIAVTNVLNSVIFSRFGFAIDGGVFDLLFGNVAGPLGAASAILVLAGGVYILGQDVIPAIFPALYVAATALALYVFQVPDILNVLLGGQTLIVAFFILPDPAVRSKTYVGMVVTPVVAGVTTGVLHIVGLPQAAPALACALTNAVTPLVDSSAGRAFLRGRYE